MAPPAPKVPSAKMLAKGGFTTVCAPAELMPSSQAADEAVAEATHKAVFDEADPNRKLVKSLSMAGHIKKDPRAQLAAIDARLGVVSEGVPVPGPEGQSVMGEQGRYEIDPDGQRYLILAEGSSDGVKPIRLLVGSANPSQPGAVYATSDGWEPIDVVVESKDPLTNEVAKTHPGAVLAALARHAHKAGRGDVNYAISAHMQTQPDMHKRVAPDANGMKHIHYRTAATPQLDAHVAKHGVAKTIAHVRSVAKAAAPRVHDGLSQPLENEAPAATSKPTSFSEAISKRLANPTPTNEGTIMTASFKDRLTGAADRVGTKPAAPAAAPKVEHKDIKSKLDALVVEAIESKSDAAFIEALKSARALIKESIPANVAVDVTYTPAATEEESRGIVQQLIEFALRCGAMGWTQEGGLQSGKLELNFRNIPFVNEFGKQAKMSKAYTGMTVRAEKGSTLITAAPATPVPTARNVA